MEILRGTMVGSTTEHDDLELLGKKISAKICTEFKLNFMRLVPKVRREHDFWSFESNKWFEGIGCLAKFPLGFWRRKKFSRSQSSWRTVRITAYTVTRITFKDNFV